MSKCERFDYGDDMERRLYEDINAKSKKFDRHIKESRKGDYLRDDDYSLKSHRKFDSKKGLYSFKSHERYSISTDSDSYDDFERKLDDKRSKKLKDNRLIQGQAVSLKNMPKAEVQKDDSNSEEEEDLASARALTLKTKLILSKLGWSANNIPEGENKLVNNGAERVEETRDKKQVQNDSSLRRMSCDSKHEKEIIEERRVQTGEFSNPKVKAFGGYKNEKVAGKTKAKTPYEYFSDFEDGYAAGIKTKDKNRDDDLIALNIKECRNMIDSSGFDCEEIRNVKVQPKFEKSKIKRRQYFDDVERVPSDSEDVQVIEPKRFKKSPRFCEEEEMYHLKDDKGNFKSGERRRVTMKEHGRSKMRKRRSRSMSSFSEDSYSSYERRRPRRSHRNKYGARDSFGWKEKKRVLEERHEYNEHFRNSKWSSKQRRKSQTSELKEKVQEKSQVDLQLVKEEKPKKASAMCDYFDEGSHWCEKCNVVYEEAVDYLKHLHSDSHQKSMRKDPKPWEEKSEEGVRAKTSRNKISLPLKGLEFMIGTSAFYCKLCSELLADGKLAEKHIKSESHNGNYRDFLQKNPNYAKLRTMDEESAMAQTFRVTHQEDFPEVDCDPLPAISADEVKEELTATLQSAKEMLVPKKETNVVEKGVQRVSVEVNREPTPEQIAFESNRPTESKELESTSHRDLPRKEIVRQEPIVLELRSKPDKVSLGVKSAQNPQVAKDAVNATTSMSSLKKLPFIGKRPSKISFKNENESEAKPQVAPTNSASLSREELLSRVMKDTVIIQPKDVRITPFPGIPPEGMLGGYMGGYVPMVAPYMGYSQYGAYYDMNMYYDPSFYASAAAAATPAAADASKSRADNDDGASNAKIAIDVESECAEVDQDHYENYTIGCDGAPFNSSVNIEDAGSGQILGDAESSEMDAGDDQANSSLGDVRDEGSQGTLEVCEFASENAQQKEV